LKDVRERNRIELPFGRGKTNPVAAADVARVVAAVLADPGPHLGRTYELTGPRSQDMHGVAREYSDALEREVTYSDIPPEDWERELKRMGLPEHLTRLLVTMAELNRAGRYDRLADGVERVTGRPAWPTLQPPKSRSSRKSSNSCWPFREEFSLLAVWAELRTTGTKDQPKPVKQDLQKANQL
jgi:hypothetical protein